MVFSTIFSSTFGFGIIILALKNCKTPDPNNKINGKTKKQHFDGALSEDGRIWGTYMHVVFDADAFRRDFLNRIRKEKGWNALSSTVFNPDGEFDKLADLVRKNTDMKQMYTILRQGL